MDDDVLNALQEALMISEILETSIYLNWSEYSSTQNKKRHISSYEIDNRDCSVTFKENDNISRKHFELGANQYKDLITFFNKYYNILAKEPVCITDLKSPLKKGVYRLSFKDIDNSYSDLLFDIDDPKLFLKANNEFHKLMKNILGD